MPGFGGTTADKFAGLTAKVEGTAASLSTLAEAATAAAPALTNIGLAMKATSAFAIALRDALEGTGWKVNEGQTVSPAEQAQRAHVVSQLQDLQGRIQGIFGSNNQIAQIIARNIQNIIEGGDPAAALAYIRVTLQSYYTGLQNELFSTDASIRELAAELLRFLGSGMLEGN